MRFRHLLQLSTAASAILWAAPGLANPQPPPKPVSGVSFSQAGNVLTVTETSPQAVINWSNFSIGAGETVKFIQPSATASLLNRVTGSQASQIDGQLQANGRLFLLNPNGITIGSGGTISAASLLLTSSALADSDYLAGRYRFTAVPGQGNIANFGSLQADAGGTVVLSAPQVTNAGTITAPGGGVQLGAAGSFAVDPTGNGLWGYKVTDPAAAAQIAQGAAAAVNGVQRQAFNTDGMVQADAVSAGKGTVTLTDSSVIDTSAGAVGNGGNIAILGPGATTLAGRLTARGGAKGGDGGVIDTSGGLIKGTAVVDPGAPHGKAGLWRVDPSDLTIDAAGAASYENTLKTADVTLTTDNTGGNGNGDITVNAPIVWSTGQTLSLSAWHNININAPITASGNTAGLTLQYNQGGQGGSDMVAGGAAVTLSGNYPVLKLCNYNSCILPGLISTPAGLKAMATDGNYALVGDINMANTGSFASIGPSGDPFVGSLDGLGHSISNLSGGSLFGTVSGTVQNLALVGAAVAATAATANASGTGILAGSTSSTAVIENSSTDGTLSAPGVTIVGGLVGSNAGTISDSYSTANVVGNSSVGGLAGAQIGTIQRSFALGAVRASGQTAGGLVGTNGALIVDSYATGSVAGNGQTGSLVGLNQAGASVATSYSTGLAIGSDNGTTTSPIDPRALPAGWTLGPQNTPILAGRQTALIIAAGDASMTYGQALPSFTSSYSDKTATVSGLTLSVDGGTNAKTSPGAGSHTIDPAGATAVSAIGYPVTNIIYQSGGLTVAPAALTVTANDATRVYGAANPSFTLSYAGWVNGEGPAALPTAPTITTGATPGSVVGSSQTITAGGPATDGNYTVSYKSGTLTITPAPLTVTANDATRLYGAANPSFTLAYAGFVNGDTPTLLTSLPTVGTTATTSSGAGVYAITPTGDSLSIDYAVTYVPGKLTVTPTPLTWSVAAASATYGSTPVLGQATFSGVVNGDQVTGSVGAFNGTVPLTLSAALAAGTYSQSVTGLSGNTANYVLAQTGNTSGALTILPAPLTVTAGNAVKLGGKAIDPAAAGYTVHGLINGDNVTGVALSSPGAGADAAAGLYPVQAAQAGGTGLTNYVVTYVDGVLKVLPGPQLQSQQVAVTRIAAPSPVTPPVTPRPPADAPALASGRVLVPGLVAGIGTITTDEDFAEADD